MFRANAKCFIFWKDTFTSYILKPFLASVFISFQWKFVKAKFWLIVTSICTTNSRTVNHDIFKKVIESYTTAKNVLFITPLRLTLDVLNHVMSQISLVPSLRLKLCCLDFSTGESRLDSTK